jgi:hypothetical protein
MPDPLSHDGIGTPRWVKLSGIIGGVLVLLVVIMILVGGDHGPWRHMPGGDAPPSSLTGRTPGEHTPAEGRP